VVAGRDREYRQRVRTTEGTMTSLSFLAIALGLAGVFGVFWWLVEWTGGLAGSALSVCRSVSSGLGSWRSVPEPFAPIRATSSGALSGELSIEDVASAPADPSAEITVAVARVHRDRRRP
jgi:hypothetical protein